MTSLRRPGFVHSLLLALLSCAWLAPPAAQAAPLMVAGERNLAVADATLKKGQLSTLLFDVALLNNGLKIYANNTYAIGRPTIGYEFRLDIPKIVEYTPLFPGQLFDAAVNPVVKGYPANGQWSWTPWVELSAPENIPRIFRAATVDGVFDVTVTVDSTPGQPISLLDLAFDLSLNFPLLAVTPGNNLSFVGNVASTLQHDNLIDRQGLNVYNCSGQPCFGALWETFLTCNAGPIPDLLAQLPSNPAPGKVKVTTSQKVWTVDFTSVQENPPPTICSWD